MLGSEDPYIAQIKDDINLTIIEESEQLIERHLGDIPDMLGDLNESLLDKVNSATSKFKEVVDRLRDELGREF